MVQITTSNLNYFLYGTKDNIIMYLCKKNLIYFENFPTAIDLEIFKLSCLVFKNIFLLFFQLKKML